MAKRLAFFNGGGASNQPTEPAEYRYRWSDEVHGEMLARLLDLNAEPAVREARAGCAIGRAAG